jgi:hypothetical protein
MLISQLINRPNKRPAPIIDTLERNALKSNQFVIASGSDAIQTKAVSA